MQYNYHCRNTWGPVAGMATNINAEIQAATAAFRQAEEAGKTEPRVVTTFLNSRWISMETNKNLMQYIYHAGIENMRVYTDSEFLINCMTKWIFNWQNNGWHTANANPVKNKQSLIACFNALCDWGGNVDWVCESTLANIMFWLGQKYFDKLLVGAHLIELYNWLILCD